MKVLVATEKGQGQRENDFCYVPEGEMVHFGFECDGEGVDGRCGCRRSLCGVKTQRATTTSTVADSSLTEDEYSAVLEESYRKSGSFGDISNKGLKSVVFPEMLSLLDIAKHYEPGQVLEKRGDVIQQREVTK